MNQWYLLQEQPYAILESTQVPCDILFVSANTHSACCEASKRFEWSFEQLLEHLCVKPSLCWRKCGVLRCSNVWVRCVQVEQTPSDGQAEQGPTASSSQRSGRPSRSLSLAQRRSQAAPLDHSK